MKYIEVVKKAKVYGFKFFKMTKGSHEMWKSDSGQFVIIPNHKGRDIPQGTSKAILKTMQIDYETNNNKSTIKR